MNDDQDQALNTPVEENNGSEAPTEKTNLPETEVEAAEPAGEVEETDVESKKSANYRIRELNTEKKLAEEKAVKLEERAKSLEDRIAELTGQVVPNGESQYNPPAFGNTQAEPLIKPGEEYIDPVELERRLQARDENNFRRTAALIDLQSARERNLERINKEAQSSVKKYPELDPDSERFDKDLSDTVYEAVEAYVKSNPTGSVKGFVDKLIKPYKRSIEQGVGEQRETLAKQASQGALRPTQVPKGEKPFEALSLKEMEERLGGVHH